MADQVWRHRRAGPSEVRRWHAGDHYAGTSQHDDVVVHVFSRIASHPKPPAQSAK